jgi:UDP-N-acetylmuramate--alanine ligase
MQSRESRRQTEPLIDLSSPRHCHVVGIGGPGMSAIALLLHKSGHTVSGSDLYESDVIEQLRKEGVSVSIGHDASLVQGKDVVLYSTAIPLSNVEIVEAERCGIPVRHRSGILASLCAVSHAIGVAGTHGKTTTTALIAHIMGIAGQSPSSLIGAEVVGAGIGAQHGASEYFIVEADESDGTLDVLPLSSIVLTNVDVDHLDYFSTFEAIQECFIEAATSATQHVVLNSDDPGSRSVIAAVSGNSRVVTFGTKEGSTFQIVNERSSDMGIEFELVHGSDRAVVASQLRGHHNVMNIAAAIALSVSVGIALDEAADAVTSFPGVMRRFTERGSFAGALLIDDYAHLPAEIEATLLSARSHPALSGKLIAVFQPNRYHRIATMADTYSDCFVTADVVVITDVYASGTTKIDGVTGELVVRAITQAHPDARVVWAPSRADTVSAVQSLIHAGDVCVSMGCGDIETFPDDLSGGML